MRDYCSTCHLACPLLLGMQFVNFRVCSSMHKHVIEIMLHHGADLFAENKLGCTPLDLCPAELMGFIGVHLPPSPTPSHFSVLFFICMRMRIFRPPVAARQNVRPQWVRRVEVPVGILLGVASLLSVPLDTLLATVSCQPPVAT